MVFFKWLRVVYSERKLSAGLFCILAGVTFLILYFARGQVSSRDDLVEVKSSLNDCSFIEHRGLRQHTFQYYLTLDGYRAQFQIGADFVDLFYKDEFTRQVKQGDTVSVWIQKSKLKDVQKDKRIIVFVISTKQRNYMEDRFTISEYNSSLRLYSGLAFILVGAFLFFNDKEKFKLA